jgi:ribonuclease BN (tRNA processing enzyme)
VSAVGRKRIGENSGGVDALILGSGGWMPSECRETACVLLRRDDHALMLDAGTGVRRLATNTALLDGVVKLDVVLTHFHLDHVCGLSYLPALPLAARVWAPGKWLYGTSSEALLGPLRRPPISASAAAELGQIHELTAGRQQIGVFTVTARAQLRHWAPTAGLRVDDEIALVTDTAYDPEGVPLVQNVKHLLHEAWSPSAAPRSAEGDATGRDAARIAAAAHVDQLTLIHLNPLLSDQQSVLEDARAIAPDAQLGEDGKVLLG